ncbi:MAG: hypothetical protein M1834_008833 [Cirrosporium novae-zelandiae]|nr:MAG: hypothetical protein M1834_008833 [Cirrosporium novae-zelandiae]
MVQPTLYKNWLRALSRWPADPLRPDVSFQKAMLRRVEKHFNPATTVSENSTTKNPAQSTVVKVNKAVEMQQLNMLNAFLDNKYQKKYALSDNTLKPLSNSDYYKNLIIELDEAPNRSWFGRTIRRWTSYLRFS